MIREYSGGENPRRWDWAIRLALYAVVDLDSHVVFPDRGVHATLSTDGEPTLEFVSSRLIPPTEWSGESVFQGSYYQHPRSEIVTAHQGDQQAILTGPGPIMASAQTMTDPDAWLLEDINDVTARFELEPVFSDDRSVVVAALPRGEVTPEEQERRVIARWARG